jgi:phosphopantetheinyl transferase
MSPANFPDPRPDSPRTGLQHADLLQVEALHVEALHTDTRLWLVSLDNCPDDPPLQALSAAELQRGDRYRTAARRRQFFWTRVLGREIFSASLGTAPDQILWSVSGPPFIQGLDLPRTLQVSLSHTGNTLAIALTHRQEQLGIDVETEDSLHNPSALLQAGFTVQERQLIMNLPADEQALAVLRLWTAKEACLKSECRSQPTPIQQLNLSAFLQSHALEQSRSLKMFSVPVTAIPGEEPEKDGSVRLVAFSAIRNESPALPPWTLTPCHQTGAPLIGVLALRSPAEASTPAPRQFQFSSSDDICAGLLTTLDRLGAVARCFRLAHD